MSARRKNFVMHVRVRRFKMLRAFTFLAICLGVMAGCSRQSASSLPPTGTTIGATTSSPWSDYSFVRQPHAGTRYKSLYSFKGRTDGAAPNGLVDESGTLYGTTAQGGAAGCGRIGCGTVFAVSTQGQERVLYRFRGGTDGAEPSAEMLNVNGMLYGTTYGGGGSACGGTGCGVVFEISTHGSERVLYRFKGGADGANPSASLILANAALYGSTTYGGGSGCGGSGCGAVFGVNASNGTERVLHRFKGGKDGVFPRAGLIVGGDGMLYGTTTLGGDSVCTGDGCGTVFEVNPSTGAERVLYAFPGGGDGVWPRGAFPEAGLLTANGALFGTTSDGGTYGNGTVFEVNASGKERVLRSFGGYDGAQPAASLIDVNGVLYGSTSSGGRSRCYDTGCGTVFEVSMSGMERVLYNFHNFIDGVSPQSPLIDVNDKLYGTTVSGGGVACGNRCGTVFEATP